MIERTPALRFVLPALILLVALVLSACGGGRDSTPPPDSSPTLSPQRTAQPTSADLPLRVGVTLPVFADFVREMGGDNVEVFSILPPDADPHTYEPTAADIQRIAEADIIFVNDREPGVEGPVLQIIEDNKGEDTKVIPFMPNIRSPRARELGDPEITAIEAGDNPHLWLDPLQARIYANIVSDSFIIEDGINAAFYNGNLTDYGRRLFQLSDDIAAIVQQIPPENRKLVTYHDAFPHLARRFGLELVGFLIADPGQEPGPGDIADLTAAISEQGIPAVFTGPRIGAESRALEQVAADAGVPVCTLYSDNLSDDESTYIDMMRLNADELLRCLGEDSPP